MIDELRRLTEVRFPEIGPILSIEPIDGGWDYFTNVVNGEWVVQVPRASQAAEGLLRQVSILPELARELSAAIPVPLGTPNDPPMMAYRRLDGTPATSGKGTWPERLGRVLHELHLLPPEFVGLRPSTAQAWLERMRAEVAHLRPHVEPRLTRSERAAAERMLDSVLDPVRRLVFATGVVHGDLASEHVLVTSSGDLAGVIDWGDVTVGDPAIDLWWVAGRPEIGERILDAYGGEPDPTFRERAGFYFRLGPWYEIAHGEGTGRSDIVERGVARVRERLA